MFHILRLMSSLLRNVGGRKGAGALTCNWVAPFTIFFLRHNFFFSYLGFKVTETFFSGMSPLIDWIQFTQHALSYLIFHHSRPPYCRDIISFVLMRYYDSLLQQTQFSFAN
jgi:hypothetical protein